MKLSKALTKTLVVLVILISPLACSRGQSLQSMSRSSTLGGNTTGSDTTGNETDDKPAPENDSESPPLGDPILEFGTANSVNLDYQQVILLQWRAENVTNCTITDSLQILPPITVTPISPTFSGTEAVTVQGNHTFTFSCSGGKIDSARQLSVGLKPIEVASALSNNRFDVFAAWYRGGSGNGYEVPKDQGHVGAGSGPGTVETPNNWLQISRVTTPRITQVGATYLRQNECASNEVVVGVTHGPVWPTQPVYIENLQLKCAPLIPGVEFTNFTSQPAYKWINGASEACPPGKVQAGNILEPDGTGYAWIRVRCAEPVWRTQ